MKCLNCGEEMMNHFVQTKKQQIAYDLCEACGSLWLDKGELDKLAFQVTGSIEFSSTKGAGETGRPARPCPRCKGVDLDRVNFIGYSDTVLDKCSRCGGFWLDGGELDLINTELEKIMPVEGKGLADFVNNVHIPYWHKRLRRKSSETDFEPQVPPIKGAELISETEYACPACSSKLGRYKMFRIKLEGCPKCRGLFLDEDELRKLKDAVSKRLQLLNLRWMDDEVEMIGSANVVLSARVCPKCDGQRLLTTSFGDSTILMDYCPKCQGVWLDENEFQEIMQELRSKFVDYSSKEMAKEAYEEIKEIWSGPENVVSEVLDARAAILALLNTMIFERPRLCQKLMDFGELAARTPLG